MDQALIQDVVSEVMRQLAERRRPAAAAPPPAPPAARSPAASSDLGDGVYASMDQCVSAAADGQEKLLRLSLEQRDQIVRLIKSIARQNAHAWGQMELSETKIGRLDHKIEKLQILELVPGVEFLRTEAQSGGNGVCLHEYAPFGVIGAITPVTHVVPTLTANCINMIAAGNAIVANPHPSGIHSAVVAVRAYNRAIREAFGVDNLVTCIDNPTLESAEALFNHRGVPLLCVTGGPGVARAAMAAKKRAIVAGPGNPPVVVDETACLRNAAASIVKGGAYDNNLLCIGEKQVFVVESVLDRLTRELQEHGGSILSEAQIDALTRQALPVDPRDGKAHVSKDFVGRDAAVLAQAAGAAVPPTTQLLFGETQASHPFVQEEQMMPFVPLVRCRNVEEAIDLAIESEHGFRHTAIIHSRNLETITRFGRRAGTTLFVVNGPCMAGLGLGGQGYLSYSIATPTGEGITTPLTFTRYRRVMMTGSLRMI